MAPKQATMEELVSHMFIMGRLMRDKMHRTANSGQCTLLEFETLRYVKEAGKPHMREVAKTFHVTPPAATLMIDGLVKARLLARVLDPKDRRSVRVALTPKGKQLLERGVTNKVREMKKLFGTLTSAERTHFVAALKKIIKNNS
ncbi:MAG TPA: MarR family transcriptional regulator [Candidatus Paceibacterota bacterium]|nr:MarR family transcriptional regulator [Candidatus Paceibacterota bacterium]